ncbi:MAG: hypothetical protein OEV72_11160 [Thermoleophilia bacterium]|nr:hypothetical protein [Thermoleophilia bacterium]
MRRAAIAFFFASVALNACLGIVALVMGDFGQTQGKVLGTSLCVTAAVMLALAATPAWERRLLGPVPAVGASSGAVGFALLIVAIWLGEDASPTLGKAVGTALTVGGAGSLASLLALPRLAPRHRHVLTTALALGAVAAAMVLVQIWGELDSSLYARALGVVAVLLAEAPRQLPHGDEPLGVSELVGDPDWQLLDARHRLGLEEQSAPFDGLPVKDALGASRNRRTGEEMADCAVLESGSDGHGHGITRAFGEPLTVLRPGRGGTRPR